MVRALSFILLLLSLASPRSASAGDVCFRVLQEAGYVHSLSRSQAEGVLPRTYGPALMAGQLINRLGNASAPHSVIVGNHGIGRTREIFEAVRRLPEGSEAIEINLRQIKGEAAGRAGQWENLLQEKLKAVVDEAQSKGLQNVVLVFRDFEQLLDGGGQTGQAQALPLIRQFIERQNDLARQTQIHNERNPGSRRPLQPRLVMWTEATGDEVAKLKDADRMFLTPLEMIPPSPLETLEIVEALAQEYEPIWKVQFDREALLQAIELADADARPHSVVRLLDEVQARFNRENVNRSRLSEADQRQFQDIVNQLKPLQQELARLNALLGVNHQELAAIQTKQREGQALDPGERRALSDYQRRLAVIENGNGEVAGPDGQMIKIARGTRAIQADVDRLQELEARFRDQTGVVTAEFVHETWKLSRSAGEQRYMSLAADPSFRQTARNAPQLLSRDLIGQPEAVQMAAQAVRRAANPSRDMRRPIANLLFVGPSSVGKTYLAELLGALIFGEGSESVYVLNGEEFQEKHSISRIIGSPPGYVGSEDGGQLTNEIRKRRRMVVVIDEIEKMHPDVRKVFYTALRSGYMTDAQGRRVPTNNIVFVATSNAGMELISRTLEQNPNNPEAITTPEFVKEWERTVIRDYGFDQPFLNRFTENGGIVPFRPLTPEALALITVKESDKLERRYESQGYRVNVEITPEALQFTSLFRYRVELGAANVRMNINDLIEVPMADELLLPYGVTELEGGLVRIEAVMTKVNQADGTEVEIPAGLRYVLSSREGTEMARLELRPINETRTRYQLFDVANDQPIGRPLENYVPLPKDATPADRESSVSRVPGADQVGALPPSTREPLSIEAARMAVPGALNASLGRLPNSLSVDVQDSFRDFIAQRGRERSAGDTHIATNLSLHLERPIVALMRMPELANAAKVEVIYRAPDQPGTINNSFGEVFYRFRDSQGNILKDVIGNLHSTDGSDNSPPGLAGTNGMLLQIPPPAPSTSSLLAPGTSIVGPGFPLPQ